MEVRPIAGAVGANLRREPEGTAMTARCGSSCARAFLEYKVIAVRGQEPVARRHDAGGREFGEPCYLPVRERHGRLSLYQPRWIKERASARTSATTGNTDTCTSTSPAPPTLLYSLETPVEGRRHAVRQHGAAYASLFRRHEKTDRRPGRISSGRAQAQRGGPGRAHGRIQTMRPECRPADTIERSIRWCARIPKPGKRRPT